MLDKLIPVSSRNSLIAVSNNELSVFSNPPPGIDHLPLFGFIVRFPKRIALSLFFLEQRERLFLSYCFLWLLNFNKVQSLFLF